MGTFTIDTEYVEVTCGADDGGCSVQFAMARAFYDQTKRSGQTWYCPNGHPRVWSGKTSEQKLKESEAREIALKDQLAAAVRDAESTRVQLVQDRQRFANGVCPCCNRSFENVRRHMESQHPGYDATKIRGGVSYRCSCGKKFENFRGLRTHQGHMRGDDWDKPTTSRYWAHLTVVGAR